MFYRSSNLVVSFLLLSSCFLNVLGQYTLGIQKDDTSPGLNGAFIWSSVAVYADDVDTTTFTQQQLYGLAQKAWNEMKVEFVNGGIPNKRQAFTMSAMGVGNLIYFSSSNKGTNYVQSAGENSPMAIALNKCQAGLQEQNPALAYKPGHRTKAACGEIGCLLYQSHDTATKIPGFNADKKVIVAYGGGRNSDGIQMPCCGSPLVPNSDPTSWGCYQFMQSQSVNMPDTTTDPLELPAVTPLSIRYVNVC